MYQNVTALFFRGSQLSARDPPPRRRASVQHTNVSPNVRGHTIHNVWREDATLSRNVGERRGRGTSCRSQGYASLSWKKCIRGGGNDIIPLSTDLSFARALPRLTCARPYDTHFFAVSVNTMELIVHSYIALNTELVHNVQSDNLARLKQAKRLPTRERFCFSMGPQTPPKKGAIAIHGMSRSGNHWFADSFSFNLSRPSEIFVNNRNEDWNFYKSMLGSHFENSIKKKRNSRIYLVTLTGDGKKRNTSKV